MTESSIKKLPQILINRIAAGEVIERPSSVVKELVENSIDADASNVEVEIEDGGRGYICVKDDGKGMSREDIALAIERHATSKLPDENLFNINSFGFRGEALPSIASISKTKISSLAKGSNQAWQIEIEGGKEKDIKPSNIKKGTIIEIRDLFYATPARLKFLKTERTERARIVEVIKRLAMANPKVNFILRENGKNILNYVNNQEDILNPRISRLAQILGKDFEENSVEIDAVRDNAKVSGYASIPTYNKGNSLDQYLFVNNRPVKDRVILGALKGAYHDFLAPQRYAVAALFIDLPAHEVDVNVHPAKAEVRFRFESEIRGLLVGSIKSALASAGHRASTTISDQALSSFRTEKEDRQIPLSSYQGRYGNSNSYRNSNGNIANRNFNSDIYSPIESGEYGERSNANLEYFSANQQNNIHNFNSSEGQFLRPNENSGENSGNPAFSISSISILT